MQSLPSDMRTPVFKMVVKNGGKKEVRGEGRGTTTREGKSCAIF